MTSTNGGTQMTVMIKTKGRSDTIDVDILSDAELEKCVSMADAIRKCIAKDKNYSNGTIARFLSKHHSKKVPPQWVYNVRNQHLKK